MSLVQGVVTALICQALQKTLAALQNKIRRWRIVDTSKVITPNCDTLISKIYS